MRLQHIDIHPLLKGYIEKIWVFESGGRVPDEDMKLQWGMLIFLFKEI